MHLLAWAGRTVVSAGFNRRGRQPQLPPPCQEWEIPEVGSLSFPNVSLIYTISMNFPFLPVKVINTSFIPSVLLKTI